MRRLAGTLAWAGRGVMVTVPSEEALSNVRARLGSAPLRLLFENAAGPLAEPGSPGAFWRGPRLASLDGTTLDLQDTEANRGHFGGPSTKEPSGRKLRGAFPQARLLALAECGARALTAAACGSYSTGEKTPAGQGVWARVPRWPGQFAVVLGQRPHTGAQGGGLGEEAAA